MNRTTLVSLYTFASLLLGGSIASAGPVNFGGFISNGYLESSHYNYLVNSSDGSTDFVEIGANAVWSPFDRATLNGQAFAFELGPYGNYDPLIDYLFLDYAATNNFGLRIGRIKRPAGVYSEIQDIDVARSTILLPIGIYDQRYRDVFASFDGISTYGSIPFFKNTTVNYNLFGGLADLQRDGGLGGFIHSRISGGLDNTEVAKVESEYVLGHQLWWNTPLPGLRAGASFSYYNEIEIEANANLPQAHPQLPGASFEYDLLVDYLVYMYSLEYYVGDWTFVGEFYKTETKVDETQTIAQALIEDAYYTNVADAWYLSASKRLFERFNAGVTYTEFYINTRSRSNYRRFIHDLQFSVRYDATDFWSLKAEYHDLHGTNRLFNQFNQNPTFDEHAWSMFALKSTFSF